MSDQTAYITLELLQLVSAGNEPAFEQFYKAYWPQVYGTGLHLTKSPEQAQDLSREIFIKVWNNRSALTDVKNINGFLYTVSRNLIMDHLRKKVFDPSNIDFLIHYFQDADVSAQEKMEYKELEEKMHGAIESLPVKLKEVFKLSRIEGLTHEQIASRLGISVVTSKTYIVRTLQEIRNYLSSHSGKHVLLMLGLLYSLQNKLF